MRTLVLLAAVSFLLTAGSSAQHPPPGAAPRGGAISDEEVFRRLERMVPELRFSDAPFDQVIEWFDDQLGDDVSILAKWPQMADSGLERDKPISLNVRNVSMGRALELVLLEAGGSDVPMAYEPENGVLVVGTRDDVYREAHTRTYPVRDLIAGAARSARRVAEAQQAFAARAAQPASLVEAADPAVRERATPPPGRPVLPIPDEVFLEQSAEELMDVVVMTIEPDAWAQNGGASTIQYYNGTLVVRASKRTHRALGRLLDELRETRAGEEFRLEQHAPRSR